MSQLPKIPNIKTSQMAVLLIVSTPLLAFIFVCLTVSSPFIVIYFTVKECLVHKEEMYDKKAKKAFKLTAIEVKAKRNIFQFKPENDD